MDSYIKTEESLDKQEFAGFWIRFGANLIDNIIVGIPLLFFGIFIFSGFIGSSLEGTEYLVADPEAVEQMTDAELLAIVGPFFLALAGTSLICVLISGLYFVLLQSSKWQATIGKKLLGLKVTDKSGNRISFWRSLGRYLVLSILSGIFMIGFIMAAFTEKKQALHDLIAGTTVIKTK